MPLDTLGLQTNLIKLFAELPADAFISAAEWAHIMGEYAASVTPLSTGVSDAQTDLEAELVSAFSNAVVLEILPDMEIAFANFAATVGVGMAPPFVAVPPPGPVGFIDLGEAATNDEGADNFTDKIDVWMKTGTATPSGGGPAVNWL